MRRKDRRWAVGVLAGALAMAGGAHAETLRYVALVDGGTRAGQQVVTTDADGRTRVEFVFKDNGRGPELVETYTLAADGTYRDYAVTGTSTFGAKVDERFRRDGDRAEWKSTSDAGEMPVTGQALYAPLGGTPAGLSVALRALAADDDGRLPMIPSGSLSAERVASAEVARDGETRTVELVALTGLGLVPTFAWATTGDSPRLFAFIYPGYLQLVEAGWEANADALEARQKAAEGEALRALQSRLSHPVDGDLLIRNARVFDSQRGTLGPAADVLVRDGRIVEVATDRDWATADHGATAARHMAPNIVDAGGRVLMPGLVDSHAHVGRWEGGLNLASGVTTVRDMGNDNATLQQLMAQEREGTFLSPRIVAAGFLEGESPFSARNGFVVSDLDGAKAAVDWYADNGYPQIKIYNSFPRDILHETVDYAHGKGLRVSGHVPAFMRAQEVVDAGFDELQHINQLLLNFFVKPDTDTRTLKRFYLVADETAGLDFGSAPVREFIASLAEKGVVVDPTLATFEFLHQRDGEMSPIVADIADHLPPSVQRGRRAAEMDIPDDATAALYDRSFAKLVEFVGLMHEAGVPVVAGTDEIAGFTLQRELELYVQAGMTPGEALRTATWNGAKYAGVLEDRGAITPGRRADLILVDGDPTRDIADIRKVAFVLKGDTVYYPSELHEALGVAPFAEPVRVQRGLAGGHDAGR